MGPLPFPAVIPTYAFPGIGVSDRRTPHVGHVLSDAIRGAKCSAVSHAQHSRAQHLKTFTTPSAAFMSRVNLANSADSSRQRRTHPMTFRRFLPPFPSSSSFSYSTLRYAIKHAKLRAAHRRYVLVVTRSREKKRNLEKNFGNFRVRSLSVNCSNATKAEFKDCLHFIDCFFC